MSPGRSEKISVCYITTTCEKEPDRIGQWGVAAISSLGLSHADPVCCTCHKKTHSPTRCVILNLQCTRKMAHMTWAVGLNTAGGSRGTCNVMYSVRVHGDMEVQWGKQKWWAISGSKGKWINTKVPFSTSSGSSSSGGRSSTSSMPAAASGSPGTNLRPRPVQRNECYITHIAQLMPLNKGELKLHKVRGTTVACKVWQRSRGQSIFLFSFLL